LRLYLVGEEERDDLRVAYDVCRCANRQAGLFCPSARRAALAEPDLHVDARVAQIQRVRGSLAPVAQDGDLAREEVDVSFAVDRCHLASPSVSLSGKDVLPARLRR